MDIKRGLFVLVLVVLFISLISSNTLRLNPMAVRTRSQSFQQAAPVITSALPLEKYVYITYKDGQFLKYAVLDKNNLQAPASIGVLENTHPVGDSDMAIDSLNRIHVAYYSPTALPPLIKYKELTTGLVEQVSLIIPNIILKAIAIAVDNNNIPMVAVLVSDFTGVNNYIFVSKRPNTWLSWAFIASTPNVLGGADNRISLSIDNGNIAHLTYVENYLTGQFQVNSLLKEARFPVGPAWPLPSNSIKYSTVDQNLGATNVYFNNINVDTDNSGNTHVASVLSPQLIRHGSNIVPDTTITTNGKSADVSVFGAFNTALVAIPVASATTPELKFYYSTNSGNAFASQTLATGAPLSGGIYSSVSINSFKYLPQSQIEYWIAYVENSNQLKVIPNLGIPKTVTTSSNQITDVNVEIER